MHEHESCCVTRGHAIGAGVGLLGIPALLPRTAYEVVAAEEPPSEAIVVTLLGTGTPSPLPDRFGPATLVQAGALNLVFDTGRGVPIRLNQIRIPMSRVDAVFITHFHSDHLNGLPDIWMTGYLPQPFGNRLRPMELWGPSGTVRIAAALRETFRDDMRIRMADQNVPRVATEIAAHEYKRDGVILERNGVTVTAFEVNHGPLIKPAYGYRIDHAGRSVLISGDTKFNENVIAHGRDVDLLIHEVCAAPPSVADLPEIRDVLNHHTGPEEAGTVFTRARPRLAAYTHFSQPSAQGVPPVNIETIVARTRVNWDGALVAGTDLLRFVVARDVTVQRWDPAKRDYATA